MRLLARFRTRSLANTLLIWSQHVAALEAGTIASPSPTYVAGFAHWKQMSRSVDMGQPGYMIYAPSHAQFATAGTSDPDAWWRLAPREKPRAAEVVPSKLVGYQCAFVRDVSQPGARPRANAADAAGLAE